ncbi:MAG: LysR family transcriptional regulator [Deinococcus-Thermus bacterium]|nr:LysR family transcriptional regulator [Deinococcota bacterium]
MIEKLEMFVALANERHFGRAAERCGVTQPTLSAAIKQLEEALGVQLVRRGSRFQGLTPEGARALDWAHRIVGDARTMKAELKASREGLSGNLRLAVVPTALVMAERLTRPLLARHAGLQLTVYSRTSAEIRAMIDGLEADAGITYLDGEPVGRLTRVPLYEERYLLLTRADGDLADRECVTWAEAAARPLCLLTPDMQNRRILNQHMAEAGADAAPRLASNSVLVLAAHVRAGGWDTILPHATAELFAGDGRLRTLPVVVPEAAHLMGLVAEPREPHTPVLSALIAAAERMGRETGVAAGAAGRAGGPAPRPPRDTSGKKKRQGGAQR